MADDDELLAELELTGANDVDEQLLSRPVATKDDDMMVSSCCCSFANENWVGT